MLTSLHLEGFRSCAERTSLALAPLTVIAGANNVGKSSFLGVLLALTQSAQVASKHKLLLAGQWVDLGPFDELLSPGRSDTFTVGVTGDQGGHELDVHWEFTSAEDRGRADARVHHIEASVGDETLELSFDEKGEVRTSAQPAGVALQHPAALLRTVSGQLLETALFPYQPQQILSVGPYRAPPELISTYRRSATGPRVGLYGEYATETFYELRNRVSDLDPFGADLPPEGSLSRTMDNWWSYVLGEGVAVRVQEEGRFGFSVRLDTGAIENRSFGQVGFGLSQLWPILVACLASEPGDLVIIETPEAHLHPGAQHRITNLLVALAKRGRQVIVETHSEHVVAAACLAVKNGVLSPPQLALQNVRQVDGQTLIQTVPVDASGRRLAAPEGFFDQAADELLQLLRE